MTDTVTPSASQSTPQPVDPKFFRALLSQSVAGQDLAFDDMRQLMRHIMQGQLSESQIGALLAALSAKGESSLEISASAQAMRDLMLPVNITSTAVDIVGTGGDGANLFNVSTAASFVVAASGVAVAKHGNRSVSSSSGSADVLESAGIYLGLNAQQVAACIDEVGIGFMFAPNHHPAMRYAAGPRRELGIKTLFNVLGPLTNPAGVSHQVIGVYEPRLLPVLAEAFKQLGSQHALVVHSNDGLDELSIAEETLVSELKDGQITEYRVSPESVGLARASLESLTVETSSESLQLVFSALKGEAGPARDMVALNAGAALYAADHSSSIKEGVTMALETMTSGRAIQKLTQLAKFTQQFASGS